MLYHMSIHEDKKISPEAEASGLENTYTLHIHAIHIVCRCSFMFDLAAACIGISLRKYRQICLCEHHERLAQISKADIFPIGFMKLIRDKALDLLHIFAWKLFRHLRQDCFAFRTDFFICASTHRL